MFHDQHVLTNGMYLPFGLFMSCPEPPMVGYIQCGFIPSVVWRFPTSPYRQACFTLRGCLYAPICSNTPPYVPMLPGAFVCCRGYLHVIWDAGALLMLGHPHVFGCLPMCQTPPHTCMLPCSSVLGIIYMCYGGNT